jgi:hypothetical protein
MRILVRGAVLAIIALGVVFVGGSESAAQGGARSLEERVASLEREIVGLKQRLECIEWRSDPDKARDEDRRRLLQLAGLAVVGGTLPLRDGAFDVYALVRDGGDQHYYMVRSARMNRGPTDEEIKSGDYSNFPWGRYRGGQVKLGGRPCPLLWENEAGPKGKVLVAMSDGSVVEWDLEALRQAVDHRK